MPYYIAIDGDQIHIDGIIVGFHEATELYNNCKRIFNDEFMTAEIKSISEGGELCVKC